jgi:hypothetical protein
VPTHEDNGHRAGFWDGYFGDSLPSGRVNATGSSPPAVRTPAEDRSPARGRSIGPRRVRMQNVYAWILALAAILSVILELAGPGS